MCIVKFEPWDSEHSISSYASVSDLLFCFSLENSMTKYSDNDLIKKNFLKRNTISHTTTT